MHKKIFNLLDDALSRGYSVDDVWYYFVKRTSCEHPALIYKGEYFTIKVMHLIIRSVKLPFRKLDAMIFNIEYPRQLNV